MRIINLKVLVKYLRKNRGNKGLGLAIDRLIKDLEGSSWRNQEEVKRDRSDADNVHSDGFYFFNLVDHRTMVLLEFGEGEATLIWCGTHSDYESTFKNNKNTIRKWLRTRNWI